MVGTAKGKKPDSAQVQPGTGSRRCLDTAVWRASAPCWPAVGGGGPGTAFRSDLQACEMSPKVPGLQVRRAPEACLYTGGQTHHGHLPGKPHCLSAQHGLDRPQPGLWSAQTPWFLTAQHASCPRERGSPDPTLQGVLEGPELKGELKCLQTETPGSVQTAGSTKVPGEPCPG